jgi:hypothetical protein
MRRVSRWRTNLSRWSKWFICPFFCPSYFIFLTYIYLYKTKTPTMTIIPPTEPPNDSRYMVLYCIAVWLLNTNDNGGWFLCVRSRGLICCWTSWWRSNIFTCQIRNCLRSTDEKNVALIRFRWIHGSKIYKVILFGTLQVITWDFKCSGIFVSN